MIEADVVIVGGGPAGMSAAIEGVEQGVTTVLIEEGLDLGGKVLKRPNPNLQTVSGDHSEERVKRDLHRNFHEVSGNVTLLNGSEVWSVTPEKIVEVYCSSASGRKTETVKGKKIILANGAVDRISPFPGWHLPGVFTIGGLNTFVKRGVVPGAKVVVTGTGPLQIALVKYLVQAGADVAAMVDSCSLLDMAPTGWHLATGGGLDKLIMGMKYLFKIKRAQVPFFYSHVITQVKGADTVEGVVISQVDSDWRPVKGTEKEIEADIVATGYNLMPLTDIARLLGCRTTFNETFGHWLVDHNETMETSVPGVFVAGDGAAVKGYQPAIDEGKVAVVEAARQLGKIASERAGRAVISEQRRLRGARRIGKAMSEAAKVRSGILDCVTDETIVCRCEEVTFKDIKAAVTAGARDINDLKRRTRLGMGNCQGTFCGQVANELMWKAAGEMWPRTRFTVRPPIRPVPIGCIAGSNDY